MLAVPPAILDLLQIQAGTSVALSVSDGCLVVDPHPVRRYRLQDLLAQCDGSLEMVAEEQVWFSAKPTGDECL
jgi:antitoxin ChpS